nr:hypothetical protein [uncultured Rahnella sp.]
MTIKVNKDHRITVRLTDTQYTLIENVMNDGKAKTPSAALQHLLNELVIKGSK